MSKSFTHYITNNIMSNALAMQLLRDSLRGNGAIGYSGGSGDYGGCAEGSALLGGAGKGRKYKFKKVPLPPRNIADLKPLHPQTQAALQTAKIEVAAGRRTFPIPVGANGKIMKAAQVLGLFSDESRLKAADTRARNMNLVNKRYNDAIRAGTPMSKLQYCMSKCDIANATRNARLARKHGLNVPPLPLGVGFGE